MTELTANSMSQPTAREALREIENLCRSITKMHGHNTVQQREDLHDLIHDDKQNLGKHILAHDIVWLIVKVSQGNSTHIL